MNQINNHPQAIINLMANKKKHNLTSLNLPETNILGHYTNIHKNVDYCTLKFCSGKITSVSIPRHRYITNISCCLKLVKLIISNWYECIKSTSENYILFNPTTFMHPTNTMNFVWQRLLFYNILNVLS